MYHVIMSSKIVIRNCHQKFSSEIVIRNCHQKLSWEIVMRNCHEKLSWEIVILVVLVIIVITVTKVIMALMLKVVINPIQPSVFGSKFTRGGADLPPPSKNGVNGWEVPKLSWNLISYQDWCQTWGFATFRNLEPPELMVWKSDFFRPSMRFVRVPPYESWANWTNFLSSWENGDFFWGQNCCSLFHTQNEEKS